MLQLFGAAGSGSVPVEAALTLAEIPFSVVEAATWAGPGEQAKVARVNPMRQVPALVLPGGEVMTESAAILVWIAERYPEARLAPPPGDPDRAQFLRWMTYVSAAIYSLYWVKDEPSRLTEGEAAEALLVDRVEQRIAECWGRMDAQVDPGRYILGDRLTVLDLYVAVVSRFRPRRRKFYEVAPKMAPCIKRVDADPRLKNFWAERYPFEDGWEA
jgi:GST-like protein